MSIFALAPKNRVVLKIFALLNICFLSFRIFEQLAIALKNRVALKFFTVLKYFLSFQDFWASCACPEKQSVPWIHCIEYIFSIIQDFWATCACPEKQSCHEISHCIEYIFLSFKIFEQLALVLKNKVVPKFFSVLKYFLSLRIFEQLCACPENRVCPEIFQAGGYRPPHRLVRLCRMVKKEDELQFLHHFSFTYHLGCFVHSTRTQDGERTLSWHWNVCELSRIAFWNASLRSF